MTTRGAKKMKVLKHSVVHTVRYVVYEVLDLIMTEFFFPLFECFESMHFTRLHNQYFKKINGKWISLTVKNTLLDIIKGPMICTLRFLFSNICL